MKPDFSPPWASAGCVLMSDQRKDGISWTDETWNCLRGCRKVSSGCANCYAESVAARFCGDGLPYHGMIRDGQEYLMQPGDKWAVELPRMGT